MSATSQARIQRLRRLEAILPRATTVPGECLDISRLLAILGDAYGQGTTASRRRALQRDLDELLREGRIEVVDPGGKCHHYRRLAVDPREDALIWQYSLQQVRDLIAEALPLRRLDRLWQRLLHELDAPLLDEGRLRLVPDTLRLRPAELYPQVLEAVILALGQRCVLAALYEDAAGVRGEVQLHPQALLQRGPLPYLFALKNDETDPVRLYALHRMIRARTLPSLPARAAVGFDLDQAIAQGRADFGSGQMIDLELRVRGYPATLLRVCPLTDDQVITEEPEGAAFTLRVRARLPATGQLLRWLLGLGANIEVLAPAEWRQVLADQAARMGALYSDPASASPTGQDTASDPEP